MLAKNIQTQKLYAIKIISKDDAEKVNLATFQRVLKNEVEILQKLNHQNIIKLVEFNLEGDIVFLENGKQILVFYIVLEFAEGGDLFEYLCVEGRSFSEEVARYYFQQLIDAIEYLHNTQEIVHRDLKIENLLLDKDYQLKIADFGLSINKYGNYGLGVMFSRVGTRNYMAPELLEKRPYRGTSVDIFAAGVVLFIMATGTWPFDNRANTLDKLYKFIIMKDYEGFWREWGQSEDAQKSPNRVLSEDFKDLVVKLLAYNYTDRLIIEEIKDHQWFRGDLPTQDTLKTEVIKLKMQSVNQRIAQEIKPQMSKNKQTSNFNSGREKPKGIMRNYSHDINHHQGERGIKDDNLIQIETEISNDVSCISSTMSSDIADINNEYSSGLIGFFQSLIGYNQWYWLYSKMQCKRNQLRIKKRTIQELDSDSASDHEQQ
ncbi:protein kinase domain containing protein [Stylonychia lemnae]|uniref:non-specific serine/threonine protein kinase n=1 Tax=Stylonychia lemnae TaxID=5949 RepID=A0A077ZY78_STYLE|nr:protein kinase domain containing protein [Stylonychia lemnae]|eukprot:CDW73506.1 protein kinase domain containing protein [Stylonychia lemnae]